jgi:hypothetical protein
MTVAKNTCAHKKSRSKTSCRASTWWTPGDNLLNQDDVIPRPRPLRIFFNQANMSAGHRPDRGGHGRLHGGRRLRTLSDESIVKTRAPSFGRAAAGRNRHREVVSA